MRTRPIRVGSMPGAGWLRAGLGAGWLRAGLAVAAVGWGANQFAPLLLVYRRAVPLSAALVQASFGFYALGLIPGLVVAGRLADRIGRRRVMLPALLLSLLASVVLMLGRDAVALLFVGRLLAGLASAGAFASGVAWVKELSTDRPQAAARRATVLMTAGFAGGPLVAGLLAQWAPAPRVVPYLPHLVFTAVALVLVSSVPETRQPPTAGAESVRDELLSPRFVRVIVPLAPWVFGSAAIGLAYLPGLIAAQLGGAALAYTAVVTMLVALAGIVVQPLATRLDRPDSSRLLVTCLLTVVLGALVAALSAATRSPALVVVAAVVLGAGYGSCQVCGLGEVQRLARAERIGAVTAIYQALTYVGFALPFLLALAGHRLGPAPLLLIVAGLAGLTLLWVVPQSVVTRRSAVGAAAGAGAGAGVGSGSR